jgi:RHS repeat-associated protein
VTSDRLRVAALLLAFALVRQAANGQQIATGMPPFGSFGGGSFDTINLGNLDVHFCIPVVTKAGRGLPFNYSLCYDSSIWYPDSSSGVTTWAPVKNWGWRAQTDAATGYVSFSASSITCYDTSSGTRLPGGSTTTYSNWIYYDANGTSHRFTGSTRVISNFGSTSCPADQTTSLTATANDDSGYTLKATGGSGYVVARNGTQFNPLPNNGATGAGTVQDRNGNKLSVSSSGVYTDTLNKTALTITGTTNIGSSSSPTYYTYTGESGSEQVKITYKQYSVRAAFGCTSPNAFGPQTEYLVEQITLPDSSYYSFSYELDADQTHFPGTVTARLASVRLPTGGTIYYTYTGGTNGIFCIDGTTAGFSRQTPDGTSSYVRTRANSSNVGTTTVTDAAGNVSIYSFYEPSNQPPYEVERQVKTGNSSLLETVITCYNGQTPSSSCATTPTAFTTVSEITRYIQLPDSSGIQSEIDESHNSYGLLTARNEYDFGSGTPTRKRFIAYGSYASGGCSNTETTALNNANIRTAVCEDIVEDGANNWKAGSLYSYDQSAVTASGATQHANVTGARGNPTTVYIMKTAGGAAYLTKQFTYFDTGLPQTSTDANGDQYTYTYGNCDDAFPTHIQEVSGSTTLNRYMTWDDPSCNGAVLESVTDEAGATTTINYSGQYFWRPSSVVDGTNQQTSFAYSPTSFQRWIWDTGSSVDSFLTTYDSLGRVHVQQRENAPNSTTWDSVETDYNSVGEISRITQPYNQSTGGTNGTAPATTYTYDGMGRVRTVTDDGGGVTSFTYSQNIVTRSITPVPTGESGKSWVFRLDGLGRMTDVCEGSGGDSSWGTCSFNGWYGLWTKYAYDTLDDITGVTQNAQSATPQTRSFSYDALRRLTSETNPESGTTNYAWDTGSAGDLYSVTDANTSPPNVTLTYTHQAFHRLTKISDGGTNCRNFLYDAAAGQPAGANYVTGRLAEAYTDQCGSSTYTTEYFGYDADGRMTDLWQTTPNSGTQYHMTSQYFPNGVPETLSIPGAPSMTYGLDSEGRPATVTAGSGQNPVTATSYTIPSTCTGTAGQPSPSGLPTQVTYGSGDSDTFCYDPNTGRMLSYAYNVNGSNLTGTLTWNANGTLQKLVISDPFNSANNQTCNYTYDPIARLSSANCGTDWSQTFTYDAFGNLKKSGSLSFQPNYADPSGNTTNRYYSGLTGLSYDNDGRLKNDSFDTYNWDAFGDAITVGGIGETYDAFGRLVESNNAGTYTQYLYAPFGTEVAVMRAGSIYRSYIPLPGGGTFNTSSTFNTYHHTNWLGSGIFISSQSRAMAVDRSYAPFGEKYNNTGSGVDEFAEMRTDVIGPVFDATNRKYHSSQGRWISPDPAGLDAVDPTNPQTWNRYSYVGNEPCSRIDALGLFSCTVSATLSGATGLLPGQVSQIEQTIQSTFAKLADIWVTFADTGSSSNFEFLLGNPYQVLPGKWGCVGLGPGACRGPVYANTAYVASDRIPDNIYFGGNRALAIGRVSAHELGHLLGLWDEPIGDNLMSANINGIAAYDPNSTFTLRPEQVSTLISHCHQMEKSHMGGGGGGSSGGGGYGGLFLVPIYGLNGGFENGLVTYSSSWTFGPVGNIPLLIGPRRE